MDMGDEEREGVFGHLTVAFVQRDPDELARYARDDVILTLVGSSPLAGEHRGIVAARTVVMRLERCVRCMAQRIRFSHDGDRMTAHRDVVVRGETHRVGMTLHLSFTFDGRDRIKTALIEPSDPGLFDHVLSLEGAPKLLWIPDLRVTPRSETSATTPQRTEIASHRRTRSRR